MTGIKYVLTGLLAVLLLLSATGCGSNAADTAQTAAPTTVRTTAALPQEGWITADSLRVRGGAGMQYEIIGGLASGDRVEILGRTGDWYSIRFGADQIGYISGQYLTFTAPTDAPEK